MELPCVGRNSCLYLHYPYLVFLSYKGYILLQSTSLSLILKYDVSTTSYAENMMRGNSFSIR